MNRSKGKSLAISIILTVIFALVIFYVRLPAINLKDPGFYGFFVIVAVFFCVVSAATKGVLRAHATPQETWHELKTNCAVPLIICAALIVLLIVGHIIGAPLFRANAYSKLLPIEQSDFAEDIDEISFDKIPLLDSTSSNALAIRKLGELDDLVSQFEVDEASAQINYKDKPVRVSFLNYGDMFKWFNNMKAGIPAYMVVDMVTQEVSVKRLEEGIRYSPSEFFFRDVDRWLRFNYPTYIFSDTNFEIDENGHPFWVASVMTKRIGLFGGEDIKGAVLLDAVTGQSTYYDIENVPTWVDRVYNPEIIIDQYNFYGRYKNGFMNSLFGQKDVTVTTDGYNYIALDDDVWLYTGITSVSGDESNIGFILANQRTKETKYYRIAGAEEYSAMSSAQGAVQQYGYQATFPLLLNISDQPTYFMALKDSSQLVKMYAMVNVQQYQIVSTGTTVADCMANYMNTLLHYELVTEEDADKSTAGDSVTYEGVIADIRSSVIDGNTRYYILLKDGECYWAVNAYESEICAILSIGDSISLVSSETEGEIRAATKVEKK